jgi:hypothetical protein
MPGLGRRFAEDQRDRGFLLARPITMPSGSRWWYDRAYWGDQGDAPHCVGYAWAHLLEDAPVSRPGPVPFHEPGDIYFRAQLVDEWPGENYDGTSVRAGAKVCQELGYLSSYRWAFDLATVVDALLKHGPVVVGTNWYDSMFMTLRRKDAQGRYRQMLVITPGASVAGGHAYILNGVNTAARIVRVKNSWGRSWASEGRAAMSFDTLERLIGEQGEAALPSEK